MILVLYSTCIAVLQNGKCKIVFLHGKKEFSRLETGRDDNVFFMVSRYEILS